MQTKTAKRNREIIPEIIRQLEAGEVIIIPTETTYALVAHAFNREALMKISRLKYGDAPQPLGLFTRKERVIKISYTKFLKMRYL
jgi:L-threonylcarbamoyladenylate synthase